MNKFPISPDGSEFVEIVDAAEPVRILPSDSGKKVESGMALCLSGAATEHNQVRSLWRRQIMDAFNSNPPRKDSQQLSSL